MNGVNSQCVANMIGFDRRVIGFDGCVVNINPNLGPAFREFAFKQMQPYKSMFFQYPFNSVVADVEPIRLKLRDNKRVCKPYDRFPKHLKPIAERKLDNLGYNEVVQEQPSPYKSRVVVVENEEGRYKMFVDYRAINEKIVPLSVTPPKPQQIWPLLRNIKYFSLIDLNSGFFQIPLSPESKALTGISLNGKNYVYNALPPGMKCNKNGYLQTIMMDIFSDMVSEKKIVIYLGTICILGKTFTNVVLNTVTVLNRLNARDFRLRNENCTFFNESVDFLGYFISNDTLQPSEKNLTNIRSTKLPKNATELRQFLGRVNFYRHMIEGYAKFEAALRDLLINGSNKVEWTVKKINCFDHLKLLFLFKPTLTIVDPSATKLLVIKAYTRAVEGVLYQIDVGGQTNLVEYCSKKLKTNQRNWTPIHLEIFAISNSCQHFSTYLAEPAGQTVFIRTQYLSHDAMKHWRMTSTVLENLAATFDNVNYKIQLAGIVGTIDDDYESDLGYSSTEE